MDHSSSINLLLKLLNLQTTNEHLAGELKGLTQADWEVVRDSAMEYGVALILYDRLRTLTIYNELPQLIQENLHDVYLDATARNMRKLFHAGIILKALRDHNLDVIVLKGLYLVEGVYPNIGLRTFNDLDLLFRKTDLHAAGAVLNGLGYKMSTYYDFNDANQDIKHLPPLFKANSPIVEVHWSILEENEPFTVDLEGIWKRAKPARVAGVDVLTLSLEDLILHLSIHFSYQHRLRAGLRSLFDIAVILQKFQTQIDWQRLMIIAKDWGTGRVIWLTLELVEKMFGVSAPTESQRLLDPGNNGQTILDEAMQQILAPPPGNNRFTPDLAELQKIEGTGSKIKLIFQRVFIPRQVMARLYNIPPGSIKIYGFYLVRVFKLYKQYSKTMWRLQKQDKSARTALNLEQANNYLRNWMAKVGD